MKRLLALLLAFSVNAFGASAIPNTFATQPSGNVPASYLDTNFALIANYNNYSNYLVDSGTANTYVVTFPSGTTGTLAAGLYVNFKAGNDNTGASTLAVNGLTAKNITNYDATALAAGQIKAGAIVSVIYDGTQYKLAGQPGGVDASKLIGTTLASNVVSSSLTSVGTLTALTSSGTITSTMTEQLFSGATATTQGAYFRLSNTGGTSIFGIDNSAGTDFGTGGSAYGMAIQRPASTVLTISRSPGTSNDMIITGTGQVRLYNGLNSNTYNDSGGNIIVSSTAPTIASGFGSSPSIAANNTAAFTVTVGSGGTSNTGTITMPAAPNGWAVHVYDNSTIVLTTTTYVTSINATSFSVTRVTTGSGVANPWTAGDLLVFQCTAF